MSAATGDADRTPSPRADVCVVGAGPAGALVAHRLAAAGHDVVVLDAGPRFDDGSHSDDDSRSNDGSRSDGGSRSFTHGRERRMERHLRPGSDPTDVWSMGGDRDAYTATGDRHYPLNAARVKGVGGSTLHWQGMVMRLHEKDFEMESRYGLAADWPIDYADLRPYYAAAERALGVAGADDNPFAPPREEPYPLPPFAPSYSDSLLAEACEALGIATHSVPNARNSVAHDGRSRCVGYGTCKPVCPSGAKYTAEVHVRKAEAEGARVVDRAPVQRIEHDPSGETVTAVTYATPGGEVHRQTARQFVLACGGVETPRLLLLSRSEQHPDGLANGSGLVGRYFTDHPFAGVGGRLGEPTRQHHVGFHTTESHQFYDHAADDHDGTVPGSVKLEFLNNAGPTPVGVALADGGWGDDLLGTVRGAYGDHLAVGALVEQLPRKENYVGLDPSTTDDLGNPVPEIRWSLGPRERRTIERANELQRSILEELGATVEWTVGPGNTGPAFHHMGTTRMGTDPEESVVTPRLRTHDCGNLWIAGSSTFVTGGAMNPTLTVAALALKAAEHVGEALDEE